LACDQGACLCGVCTLACEQDADCAVIGEGAVCAPSSNACAAKTCQPACEGGQACPAPLEVAWACGGAQRSTPTAQGALVTVQLGGEDAHEGAGCAQRPKANGIYCGEPGGVAEVLVQGDREIYSACFPPYADARALPAPTQAGAVSLDEVGGVWRADGERAARVVVDGNQTALWGQGRGGAGLEAALEVDAPHARVRSLRLVGDILVGERGTHAALSSLHVDGDVTVEAKHVGLLDLEIHGDLLVLAEDAVLVNVGVSGDCEMGEATLCDGCYSFQDPDKDHAVQVAERGAALCAAP
jgi:hypothetical protein